MDGLFEAAGAAFGINGEKSMLSNERGYHEEAAKNGNRYRSSFQISTGQTKWFVDGCSYFWAVAEAIEKAQESIMILDWWLSPEVYLRRPPASNRQYRLDVMLQAAAARGVLVYIIVYKEVEAALTLNSEHTKSVLEGLHPNIKVFRHPDHVPSGNDVKAQLRERFGHITNLDLAKASKDVLYSLYGTAKDVTLFWAHHEKLLLVDQRLAFMGGLDLCFGRWDTNSHPIADVHPGDLENILFPGQDYNNARVFDFADVQDWSQNKLDRTKSSRMGWSDVALSLSGPIVRDLASHFIDRWNFIFDEKYASFEDNKYERLMDVDSNSEESSPSQDALSFDAQIQLVRSCSEWSSGHSTECSIFNAYVDVIRHAKHFVYIENQFFITATGMEQKPVANLIGAAIVERICRAHETQEPFKVIVVMPAVPAFAGDLKADDALGTRAILEFQYKSICRGGHSILEKLKNAGIEDARPYIGFYNLRNFDRINTSRTMTETETVTGLSYESAREGQDAYVDSPILGYGEEEVADNGPPSLQSRYQSGAVGVGDDVLDTVSSCYMEGGQSLVDMPWDGDMDDEINAYVSEELYIHSKLLIADDRVVICGSANLNDRSQLGHHDSEIAVVVEDPTPVESTMNGEAFIASKFAASLRRYIFRKHLGLIHDQRCDQPDSNWMPVDQGGNEYDWNSPSDALVADPLHADFWELWDSTARLNTETFSKAFHPVPNDNVRTWDDYKEFYAKHFCLPNGEKPKSESIENLEETAEKDCSEEADDDGTRYDYGHIVRSEFPGGVVEVKEWLAQIRGTLVEMPLEFLADVEDIAKDGLTLNDLTEKLYT